MRKEIKIKNLSDLKMEIVRLKALSNEQERYLGDQYRLFNEKVAAPVRFFKSVVSWVPGTAYAKGLFTQGTKDGDWLSRLLRIGLPLILNRFVLRRAGFFKKALVTLLSQQAAGAINKDRLITLINKITDFVSPSKSRKRSGKHVDYGIPPDSETY